MAITKNLSVIKKGLYKSILYVANPNKTSGNILVSTLGGCSTDPKLAFQQMRTTKSLYNKKDKSQAHHYVQSFKPGEVSPELAHQIGVEWMRKNLGDEYECIISTHIDRGHIHNHILFNSVNKITGKKFDRNLNQFYRWRQNNDEICQAYGLSIPQEFKRSQEDKKKSKDDVHQQRKSETQSIRNIIKDDIDAALSLSSNFDEFISKMQSQGYFVRQGDNVTHISFKKDDNNAIRGKTLGLEYTEKRIKERIGLQKIFKEYEDNPSRGKVIEIKNFMIDKELSTDDLFCIKIPKQDRCFYYPKTEALYQNWQSHKIVLKPNEIYKTTDKKGMATPPLSYGKLSKMFDEGAIKKEQYATPTDKNKRYSTKTQAYHSYKKYTVKTGRKSFRKIKTYSRYFIPYRNYNIYGYRKPTYKNNLLLILIKHLVEKNYNQKKFQQAVTFAELNEAENNIKVLRNNIINIKNTLEFIDNNRITNLQEIKNKISNLDEIIQDKDYKIKLVEGKLVEKAAIMKLTDEYIKLKPAYNLYRSSKIATEESKKFKEIYQSLMNFNITNESQILSFRKDYANIIEDLKNEIVDIEFDIRRLKKEKEKFTNLEKNINDFKIEKQQFDKKEER